MGKCKMVIVRQRKREIQNDAILKRDRDRENKREREMYRGVYLSVWEMS